MLDIWWVLCVFSPWEEEYREHTEGSHPGVLLPLVWFLRPVRIFLDVGTCEWSLRTWVPLPDVGESLDV